VDSDEAGEQVERLATPEALTDQKMTRDLLNGVIAQMTATWRATFVLHELEEMSMSEVAHVLGIPRGTVASRLRGARNEFRARVSAIDGFGDANQEGQDESRRERVRSYAGVRAAAGVTGRG
jgi:DNA-directed RNA polymerase specialized sigma24 family protein